MYAVILAGGSGTRLRPLRGTEEPVAFQALPDGRTLLQHTCARLARLVDPMDVVVVANRRHGQLVRDQLPDARIVTQPMNRGTATALALAIVSVERAADETMVVLTADHEVEREDILKEAIAAADGQIVGGALGIERPLVAFAVRPTKADRELTYIHPSFDGGQRIAGVAALWAERIMTTSGALDATELAARLQGSGRMLPSLSADDVGAGLIEAPMA